MRRRTLLTGFVTVSLAGCSERQVIGESEPADLQVSTFECSPEEVELRDEVSLSITVTNHGGEVGQGELWYTAAGELNSILIEVSPGTDETYTETITFDRTGSYTIRLDPVSTSDIRNLDHAAEIQVNPKYLEIGESWTNIENYTMSVNEPFFTESYRARSDLSGEIERYQPEQEDLYAFVPVTIENEGNGSSQVPIPDQYFSRVGSELYELSIDPAFRRPDLRGEFEDITLYDSGEIPPETTKSGYLIFEVPSEAESDFFVGWSSRYREDEVIYWE